MKAIVHDYEIAVFEQLYVVEVVRSSRIYCTFVVDGRGKAHYHHAARKVLGIVMERLDQGAAACFIDLAQRAMRIRDFIHAYIDSFSQIVAKIQAVKLNGLFNVIRRRGVGVRGFLRPGNHFR